MSIRDQQFPPKNVPEEKSKIAIFFVALFRQPLARLIRAFFCFLIIFCNSCWGHEDKVALLFLTRQDLNHTPLWQTLLEESGNAYTIYIHSKEPLKNSYFKKYRISKIVPTTWSIHVKAWQALLEEALKNPHNKKFVFLSESCVPLYPLKDLYPLLVDGEESHMAYSRPWWPPTNERELLEIPQEHRWGNYEWVILNRKHAEIVVRDQLFINIVAEHPNDQESYFATLFSINDCLKEVKNRSYTYSNFKYSTNGGASPWTFKEDSAFNDTLIQEAYQQGSYFARKFDKSYPEPLLREMIKKHRKLKKGEASINRKIKNRHTPCSKGLSQ